MKSKKLFSTLSINGINEKKYHIGFLIALVWQIQLLFRENFFSTKFLPMFVSMGFIALTINLSVYSALFLLFRRKEFYRPAFFSLCLSSVAIWIALHNHYWYMKIGIFMNALAVKYVIPARFVQVSLEDGNLLWTFMLALYIGTFLIIYGNWFIKNNKSQDGFWRIERQLVYLGIGVYGVVSIFVFIFTHFTFVGSNYLYIINSIQYVDKLTEHYSHIKQRDNFILKDLKYFNSLDAAQAYYGADIYKNRYLTGSNKKEFYGAAYSLISNVSTLGFEQTPPIAYEKLSRFHDWIQVAYNFNLNGGSKEQAKLWYSEITPTVLSSKQSEQEVLRHSILYLKKDPLTQGYYVYFVFDRTFKDYKMNYIFNLFFVMFHILYIAAFAYLIKIHQKRNLSKSYRLAKKLQNSQL